VFDIKVRYTAGQRRPEPAAVAAAVKVALADPKINYPLGDGLSRAGPVKSVEATRTETTDTTARRLSEVPDTCPSSARECTFRLTLVAFGPLLQLISKAITELDFSNAVVNALRASGSTSVEKNTEEETLADGTIVPAKSGAEVVSVEPITFAQEDAPSPSPPRSNQANLDADNTGSNISDKEAESLGGGIIFLIILLLLCFLCPLLCCCFARGRYGPGKERLYFKFKLSHSNPTFPAFYIPYEDREKMRVELYTKSSDTEKQDTSVLDDDEHI